MTPVAQKLDTARRAGFPPCHSIHGCRGRRLCIFCGRRRFAIGRQVHARDVTFLALPRADLQSVSLAVGKNRDRVAAGKRTNDVQRQRLLLIGGNRNAADAVALDQRRRRHLRRNTGNFFRAERRQARQQKSGGEDRTFRGREHKLYLPQRFRILSLELGCICNCWVRERQRL